MAVKNSRSPKQAAAECWRLAIREGDEVWVLALDALLIGACRCDWKAWLTTTRHDPKECRRLRYRP